MAINKSRVLQQLITIAITVVCLVLVGKQWDSNGLADAFGRLQLGWVAVAGIFIVISLAVRSLRWHLILTWIAPGVGSYNTLRTLYVAYLLNSILPGKLGEIVKLVLLARITRVSPVDATAAILLDRLVDGIGLGVVVLVAMAFVAPKVAWITVVVIAGIGFFLLVAVVLGAVIFSPRLKGLMNQLFSWIHIPRVGVWISDGATTLAPLVNGARIRTVLGLSIMNWLTEAGVFFFTAKSLSLNVSLSQNIVTMGVVSFGGIILSTPGGIGAHEYLVMTALTAYSMSTSDSFAMALITHGVLFFPAAFLGCVSVITIGWKSVASAVISDR